MIEIEVKWNVKSIFLALVLAAGILLYLAWGAAYGVWSDIGIYSLTIILVAFGAAGLLLSWTPDKEEQHASKKRH